MNDTTVTVQASGRRGFPFPYPPIDNASLHRGELRIPIAPLAVSAGWPSPAQDYYSGDINLNDHLIDDANATFILRVSGHSMEQAGISHGDEIIVDRSRTPKDGDIVVAILNGEMTLKRLQFRTEKNGKRLVRLQSANPDYPNFTVMGADELQIWGVATYCLHHLL